MEVLVEPLVGQRDRLSVPRLPPPGLVTGDQEDGLAFWIKRENSRTSLAPVDGGRSSFMW